jgi:hypothetical protein
MMGLSQKYDLYQYLLKNKNPLSYQGVFVFDVVVPPGIEPGTQGFSVLCSTN